MGDPEDYYIAREAVWGREGLASAADGGLADFFARLRVCGGTRFLKLKTAPFRCRCLGRFWAALGVLLGRSWAVLRRSLIGLGRS